MSELINCSYAALIATDSPKLIPNPKNPNKHPDDQIERLAKIIEYQGQRSPIVISNLSGFITKGHGRLMAIKKLGWKQVAVDYQDYENEAQEYADIVADNAIAEWSELDRLEISKQSLELGQDLTLEMLGLKDFEIIIPEILDPQTDEDEVPEVIHPITRRGDIWLLGNHRLMCGDSTMINDVEKLMNSEKADMVFTDPPYGVSYQSNMRTKTEKFDVLENDDKILTEWINHLETVSKGFVFIWTTWKVLQEWFDATSIIGKPSNLIVWNKGGGGIGDLEKTFSTDHEMALVFHRGAKITGKRLGSVWSIGKDASSKYLHPTQKPVELAETAIINVTNENQLILDFFTGSGSTLIACEKNKRKFNGLEMSEKYCDVIINRWQNYTGKKATLELTKQTYEELKAERG